MTVPHSGVFRACRHLADLRAGRHTAGVVEALPEDLEDLRPLIDRLASCGYPHTATVGRWKAMRVPRGRNNVVYRAGAGTLAVAVKFTTPDARDCHDDKELLERARAYEVLMACWWAVRFTRMITWPEPGRLSSVRLDPDNARIRQRRYLARAHELLDRSG